MTTVIDLHVLHGKTQTLRNNLTTGTFGAILFALYSFLLLRRSPLTYYAYATFPVVFWEEVFARRMALVLGRDALFGHVKSKRGLFSLSVKVLAFIGLLEALVRFWALRKLGANARPGTIVLSPRGLYSLLHCSHLLAIPIRYRLLGEE